MKTVEFKITGAAPLLMHAATLVDPLSPKTVAHKKLTSKRQKTDTDHVAIARSEYIAGCYYDPEIGVYMPVANIRRSLIGGARLFKLGKQIERGIIFTETTGFPLEYKGPKTPEELWEGGKNVDARPVVVARAKLMRYRPRFNEWGVSGSFMMDTSQIGVDDLVKCFEAAGAYCGLGNYLPLFGRFNVDL